jgi:iron(III) transport system ATP-binding protein
MSAVSIQHLHKQFSDNVILPDFSLEIEEGEFVVLLGPSGCGKTTVLRCVAGLETASRGLISIGGDIVEDGERGLFVPPQDRDLGFVFQHYALWPHMSVHENVAYPLRVRRVGKGDIDRRVNDVLHAIGLDGLGKRSPAELSGGQQQRVALARALVGSPQVLLLDEPLSNLDAQRRTGLRKQLRLLHQEWRTTTLYVTHDQTEALTLADRVVLMREGRIEQIGSPRDIFDRPGNRFVAGFLGYENIIQGRVTQVNGRSAAISSAAWKGDLIVDAPAATRVGATVELGFRAANVSVSSANDSPIPPGAQPTQIKDVTFLGDTVEYSLAAGDDHLIARVPAKAEIAGDVIGQTLMISVLPENVVLLTAKPDA